METYSYQKLSTPPSMGAEHGRVKLFSAAIQLLRFTNSLKKAGMLLKSTCRPLHCYELPGPSNTTGLVFASFVSVMSSG